MTEVRVPGSKLRKVAAGITGCLISCTILGSAFLSSDSTVLYPREVGAGDPIRRAILPLFPQNWPFFTKPASDPEYAVFSEAEDGSIHRSFDFPNSTESNLFGWSRTQRAQGPEMANLRVHIPDDEFVDCSLTQGDCVKEALKREPRKVSNSSTYPTLCGGLVLAETKPVPWEYREDYAGWRAENYAVHLNVACKEQ